MQREQITIDNQLYTYKFWGNTIARPTMESYNITEQDIAKYNSYNDRQAIYNNKIESYAFCLSMIIPGSIAVIIEYICGYFSSALNNTQDIIRIIACVMAMPLYIGIQSVLLNIFIPSKVFEYIAKFFVKKPPIKPSNYSNVSSYKMICRQQEDDIANYRKLFPGIEKNNYDLYSFGLQCLHKFISNLKQFAAFQNSLINKDRQRQHQSYWYNLDPFEFEKEVGWWFEQQGYNTQITKKSGDGGIDIILSKGEYQGYVQCKRYRTSKVDRPTLSALYGVVCADKVNQGIVVSLLGLTNEAMAFAEKVGIKVITIDDIAPKEQLLRIIEKDALCEQIVCINKSWGKVGNLSLNIACYRTKDDISKFTSKWKNPEMYHPIKYKGVYFLIYCHNNDYYAFMKWFDLQTTPNFPYKYVKRKYRKRH